MLVLTGHYNHGLESLLISHVNNEGGLFVPAWINSDTAVQKFLSEFFPGLPIIVDNVTAQYPHRWFETSQHRVGRIIGDSSFFCNTRQVFDAYHAINTPTYNLWYGVGFSVAGFGLPAYHGTDILPSFWTDEVGFANFLSSLLKKLHPDLDFKALTNFLAAFMKAFAPKFQKRLAAYSIYGNPDTNVHPDVPDVKWPQATPGRGAKLVNNVLHITQIEGYSYWRVRSDPKTSKTVCDFWKKIAQAIDPPSPSLGDSIMASAEILDEDMRPELR